MTSPDQSLRERVVSALAEELQVQNPDAVRLVERWHLSGGVTPQSSGCSINIGYLADAVLALFPTSTEVAGLVERLREMSQTRQNFAEHSEANRDGWFATMPPEISDGAASEAALLSQAAAALLAMDVELNTRRDGGAPADKPSPMHGEGC